MKSPFYFIVEPVKNRRYNNTIDIDGVDFITSTSKEDFKFSNREGVVIETPSNYKGPIKKGDKLLVHHNVFKYYNDMRGRERSGKSFLKDNTFFVDDTQYFAYNNGVEWRSVRNCCFVKPVEKKDFYLFKLGTDEPLTGELVIDNEELKDMGLSVGDIVCFTPHSEYEFNVDGEVMYRMYTHNITMTV